MNIYSIDIWIYIVLIYEYIYRVSNVGCSISMQGHFQQELIIAQYRAWCIAFMNYITYHRIIHVYCVMFNTICELNVFLSKIRYFFSKKKWAQSKSFTTRPKMGFHESKYLGNWKMMIQGIIWPIQQLRNFFVDISTSFQRGEAKKMRKIAVL